MAERVTLLSGFMERSARGRAARAVMCAALALCFAACLPGCTREEKEKDVKASSVRVLSVERKSVRPYIEAIGTLNPGDEVTISAEVDGIVRVLTVDEGSRVSPGMVLARINDTSYRLNVANAAAAVKQAEANLYNLSIEHRRKQALYEERLVTIQQFDDVTTRLAVAEQDLDRARVSLSLAKEMLSKATISSPKAGVVKARMVTTGDFVRASMPLMAIVQVNPLKLSFTITEKDVGALKNGQEVVFGVDPFPGRRFKGRISIIYPSLEEKSRTLKVEAVVPNGTLELKPGFFARLRIYTGSAHEAVVVPATAILYEGARFRVFVQEGGRARERQLRLGGTFDDLVEVLDGLTGGEKLIVAGQGSLSEGDPVAVEK